MFTQYDQWYKKQHKDWKKRKKKFTWKLIRNEMVNTTPEILRLSEDTKGILKQTKNVFIKTNWPLEAYFWNPPILWIS